MTSSSATARIPICDLTREYAELKSELDPAVSRVLSSGSYILGPENLAFEKMLASYIGVGHAVGMNSGTDAILLALRALGIGPGDDVIVPAMTFIATAEPVSLLGARPVFVDIDPVTYAIDPALVRKAVTTRTKAIIAVHLYGQSADMKTLGEIAEEVHVPLIEDMAQGIGASWEGKKVGSFGVMSCVSFFPTKNLGAYGDGGAVLTSSPSLADRLRKLRNHGASVKYQHDEVGYNTRLDEIQAAILRIKLAHLDAWNDQRRALARMYTMRLAGLPLHLPKEAPSCRHIYHLYSVQTADRDALRAHLDQKGIDTGLHYPTPLHLQSAFSALGYKIGDFPQSESLAHQVLSLPLYPQMDESQLVTVVQAIHEFYQSRSRAES